MFKIKQLLLLALLQASLFLVQAQTKAATDVLTPVKQLITQIRTSQDAQAMQQLEMEAISKYLLGTYFQQATVQQRNEFSSLFQSVFAKTAFPRIREKFKNLASMTYEAPAIKGNTATVGSLMVFNHPLKKQEMKWKYTLVKAGKGWQVMDAAVLGSSILESIRNDQVQPLLQAGGMEQLLQAMRKM